MKITLNELRNLIKSVIIEAKEEAKGTNKPNSLIAKTKKMVDELNELIDEVNPMFNDKVKGVEDRTATMGNVFIYKSISFNDKTGLTIKYTKNGKSDVVNFPIKNLEFDGIPNLQDIKRMYNSAKKKLQK
jgi:hypothetical protein